ncbi:hypothetical protein [Candidatus Accumulibacter phosphatis]|jgi:hypothetical protein|uniref:hypothetical protein n=1 Tax=Candidatus Accumulibacter phosphatis TaxID=327160 RepID=UPI00145DE1A2|nr:hypothetical protein [Candidatus Accumulibacter phosphatis]
MAARAQGVAVMTLLLPLSMPRPDATESHLQQGTANGRQRRTTFPAPHQPSPAPTFAVQFPDSLAHCFIRRLSPFCETDSTPAAWIIGHANTPPFQ